MTWQISPASLDDAPDLAGIHSDRIDATDWVPRLDGTPDDLAFVTGLVAAGGASVARREGRTLGFDSRQGECPAALYVSAEARGLGGRNEPFDAVRRTKAGFVLRVVEANEGALLFHARESFHEDGRTAGHNQEGLPDIRMVWFKSEEAKDA